ncbi:MAG: hypothetical protein JSW00_14590 [Thermoplasmata archaeon]|nr:MAG: hypothetical protein JSW00_14590 [Thermoplasmata archaeon]
MNKRMEIKEEVIKLLIELSKDFYPRQYICKLVRSDEIIDEISILSNLKKKIPELKPVLLNLLGPFSYSPFLEQFAVSPDILFEQDFVGFAISHIDDSSTPTEYDKKLFAHCGDVHIIIAHPFNNCSWAAYDNNGNKINLEIIN